MKLRNVILLPLVMAASVILLMVGWIPIPVTTFGKYAGAICAISVIWMYIHLVVVDAPQSPPEHTNQESK